MDRGRITEAIVVKITDDFDLLHAFLQWQSDTGTYSLQGYSASGFGSGSFVFYADVCPSVAKFLEDWDHEHAR